MSTDWHAQTVEATLASLDVVAERGLDSAVAQERLRTHGPNQWQLSGGRPWWAILLDQLRSVVIALLVAAVLLALATQRWVEAAAVTVVIVVNTAIGFVSEARAVRSMAALRDLGEHTARVRRDGRDQDLLAPLLVPGDIVLLAAGDLVPADLRVLTAEHLRVDEATLTGESVPAGKTADPVDRDAALADRRDLLYKGSRIADGTAVAVTVATGADTELGRIAQLTASAEAAATPLQARLDQLGRRLTVLTIVVAAVVAAVGLLIRRQDASLVVETALALGIAAIPEGLPVVATIALARGMSRMADRNALVNRLTAVETLGATGIICTDKTGTLTENRMTLRRVDTPAGSYDVASPADAGAGPPDRDGPAAAVVRVLEVGALCNAARLRTERGAEPVGDPTELALLVGAAGAGIRRADLLAQHPRTRIDDFDPSVRMMATYHQVRAGRLVAVKGAPDAVLAACTSTCAATDLDEATRRTWLERSEALAREGMRVLAMADKRVASETAEPYAELCFLGLVALQDPPRQGVKSAIDRCQSAGIRVAMVTGDQAETATAIAHAVGIVGDADDPEPTVLLGAELDGPERYDQAQRDRIYAANIFSRVSPEQKLNLVRIYQDRGDIVAMTGDGVNDAPALKKADIGVAMGRRGTEAAKQAADMVLLDDAFATIVAAVEQGRVIFGNIRKSVVFMLTTNVAEVVAVTVATLAGWPLPLLPLQILFLNMVTDVFPALALGVGPGSGHEMAQRPRRSTEQVLTRRHWGEVVGFAVVLAVAVLAALLLAEHWLGLDRRSAVTVSFLTLAFGKLWFALALRNPRSGLIRNEITRNGWIWAALALCVVLLVAAVFLPVLSTVLQTANPGPTGWALLLALSTAPLIAGQVVREVQRHAVHPAPPH